MGRELFHPKVFIFHRQEQPIAWVGSANLTSGGFLNNVEGVLESDQTDDIGAWFDQLWNALPQDPGPAIDEYEAQWTPPRRLPSPIPERKRSDNDQGELLQLEDGAPRDWVEFLDHIDRADRYWASRSAGQSVEWSVLAETYSWLETIQTGQLLTRRRDWITFTPDEVRILLGLNDKTGAWGLLGSMRGAGYGKQVFFAKEPAAQRDLRRIQASLRRVELASGWSHIVDAASSALDEMCAVHGVSTAIATRLLTLSRPDVCVSVNRGSAPKMAAAAKLGLNEATIRQPKNYRAILEWVGRQPWYNTPQPDVSRDATLWGMRAALLDVFFYEPV
jgi:hypothetical protein